MPGLHRVAVLADLVGEPSDAERGMAEHAGSQAGLLDFGIAVHDAADPAQIDIHRPDWTSARRASTISIAGMTYSVARSTSAKPTPGPCRRLLMMKASSTSTRGLQ